MFMLWWVVCVCLCHGLTTAESRVKIATGNTYFSPYWLLLLLLATKVEALLPLIHSLLLLLLFVVVLCCLCLFCNAVLNVLFSFATISLRMLCSNMCSCYRVTVLVSVSPPCGATG